MLPDKQISKKPGPRIKWPSGVRRQTVLKESSLWSIFGHLSSPNPNRDYSNFTIWLTIRTIRRNSRQNFHPTTLISRGISDDASAPVSVITTFLRCARRCDPEINSRFNRERHAWFKQLHIIAAHIGFFVTFHANAMSGAVGEVRTITRLLDHIPRGLSTFGTWTPGLPRRGLRRLLPARSCGSFRIPVHFAHCKGPRQVRDITIIRRAPIHN